MAAPTTAQLRDTIVADFQTRIGQTVPLMPKAAIRVIATVLAGVFLALYKRSDFIGLQWFISTASTQPMSLNGRQIVPLIELGRQYGADDPTGATAAQIRVSIPVTAQGGQLLAGEQILNTATGILYALNQTVVVAGATVNGTFTAVSSQDGGDGSGAIGNAEVGTTLQFVTNLAGVGRTVTVTRAVVTGANGEDLDVAYRQRVLSLVQQRPQGGAYADYKQWAEETEGIINAYPYTGDPGEVNVYVEATAASSGNLDGIPTDAQRSAVSDNIEFDTSGLASRRPAGALVKVLPITRTGFSVQVGGITQVDDLPTVQSQVRVAIEQFFRDAEPYIAGLSFGARRDTLNTIGVSAVVQDVVSAGGGQVTTISIVRDGGGFVPVYILGEGEKAKVSVVFT